MAQRATPLLYLTLRHQVAAHDFLYGDVGGEGKSEGGRVPPDRLEEHCDLGSGKVSPVDDMDDAAFSEGDEHIVVVDPEAVVEKDDSFLGDVEAGGGDDSEVAGFDRRV